MLPEALCWFIPACIWVVVYFFGGNRWQTGKWKTPPFWNPCKHKWNGYKVKFYFILEQLLRSIRGIAKCVEGGDKCFGYL